MKRPLALGFFLLTLLSIGTAPAAHAQASDEPHRPSTLRLTLRSALFQYELSDVSSDFGADASTDTLRFAPLSDGLGFRLHYIISPSMSAGLGPSIRVARVSSDFGDTTAIGVSLPAELELMGRAGKRRAYVVLGAGVRVERLRERDFDEEGTGVGLLLRVGAGLHRFLGDRFSLDPELTFEYARVNVDISGDNFEVRTITFGLSLNFSGWVGAGDAPREEAQPPAPSTAPAPAPAAAPATTPPPANSPFGPR